MISPKLLFVPLLVVFTAYVAVPFPPDKGHQAKTLVVQIDHDSRGFYYTVDGKPSSSDLLTSLRGYKTDWPVDKTKVILLAHNRTTFSMMDNSRGMIEKAGYEPPRVFYFDDNKRAMVELTFLPAVPFSPKGPVQSANQ